MITITSSGLLAIAFGITAAVLLFAIASVWTYFKVVNHSTKEDDKFEYHVEEISLNGIRALPDLAKQNWKLIGINNNHAFFIRTIKKENY